MPSLLVQDVAESRAENLYRFDASLREELSVWKKKLPCRMLKKSRLLTRPTLARRNAPSPKQGRRELSL